VTAAHRPRRLAAASRSALGEGRVGPPGGGAPVTRAKYRMAAPRPRPRCVRHPTLRSGVRRVCLARPLLRAGCRSPSVPFRPPHGPSPGCDFHLDPQGWRSKRIGTFHRRIGRHCILVHEMLRPRARQKRASEPIVMDGLGAFARGPFGPVEITGIVGTKSDCRHDFIATPRRRSGSMTDEQPKKRAAYEKRFGRPEPGERRGASSDGGLPLRLARARTQWADYAAPLLSNGLIEPVSSADGVGANPRPGHDSVRADHTGGVPCRGGAGSRSAR
jgi:hypothetical protein